MVESSPQTLDDEGAFRDNRMLEWLEGQVIKYQFIAGEAVWQLGRHLEVLKENMSLLAVEQGPEVSAEEISNCHSQQRTVFTT